MSITLDATLQTAQDGVNHRPIAEVVSSPMGEIVPTQGNYFNALTATEREPHIIELSSGRLAVVLERQGVYNELKYIYTPTDKSEWIEVDITAPYAQVPQDPCLCELSGGNVAVVYTVNQNTIYYNILSPTGTEVTAATLLYNAGSNWVANPYVILLASSTYLLVYPEGTGTPPSESNTYYLKQRTSSNFTSWGSATDITPSEFSSSRYCNNPHLTQVASDRIFLWVDYLSQYVNSTELNNVYQMYSDNDGSSWSSAENVTNITELGYSATHPTAAEKDNGDISFMYAHKSVVKSLNVDMTGYPYPWIYPGGVMMYDPDRRKIMWNHGGENAGLAYLTICDFDTWSWEKTYGPATIPECPTSGSIFFETRCEYYVIQPPGTNQPIWAVNTITDDTKEYNWGLEPDTLPDTSYLVDVSCGYADFDQNGGVVAVNDGIRKLYIWHECAGYGSHDFTLGWINLDEVADGITGLYDYNEIWDGPYPGIEISPGVLYNAGAKWDYTHDYYCSHSWGWQYTTNPGLVCWDTDGTIRLQISPNDVGGCPRGGVRSFVFIDDDVYFSFPYYTGEPDKRGLAHYRADTGTIQFHVPNWETVDEYNLNHLYDMGDGRILMVSDNTLANGGGVAIYDTSDGSWKIINNDTYPGFSRTNTGWGNVAYDPATKTIIARYSNEIIAFSEYGPYSYLKQTDIENVDTTIDYGEVIQWSWHSFEYQPNIVIDSDTILWGVWQHVQDGTEYSAKWSAILDDLDVTEDVGLTGSIQITWDVEKKAKLTFSISKGHLYDPNNLSSTLSPFFKKGRKIKVKFGENVSDTDYFEEQGEYSIISVSLDYGPDDYPVAKVTCEDLRILWEDTEVVATMYYDDETPHNALEDILVDFGGLDESQYSIPDPFQNEHNLHYQFIDKTLEDIVKELLDHYGYFGYVNMDGEFEPRYIDLTASSDHVYSNTLPIFKYTPNDEYSTFINRVIVKGISYTYSEILYGEESITSLSGTTGFWGKIQDVKVWYSNDHQDTVRYPRLEIVESIGNAAVFGIKVGGGQESITYEDPDEHYVIVTIEAPDLSGALISTILAIVVLGVDALTCDEQGGFVFSNCGWYIFSLCMLLNVAMYILGAIASYSYNIWGRPIGHEKSTFQAEANDYELQAELGYKIVQATIDDPMAYTIAICQRIADEELAVIKAQRRRIKFQKSAHLQDEVGDIIEIPHPYSGEQIKLFIASIKRTMRMGKDFVDEIEGWRIID